MKREIPTITISCGKNDMFMNPPCNSIGNTASSVNYTTWTANSSRYGPAITNLDKSFTTIPESTPYVRPDFVFYTPPSQSFIQPDTTYVVPNQSEVTKKTDPVIVNKKNIDKSVAFRKSKDYENALKSCNEALKADPKYLDGWNEKAAIFIDKAEYKTAIEYCDIAIIIDSKYFYAYNNKAIALRKLEDYEKALKSCDEALKINPGYSDAQNEKNNILQGFYLKVSALIIQKEYEQAIKACDIIIKSDAKNLNAYHNKVMALRMLEDYENALKNCDKSILYMGNINNYGIEKVEELNKLYLERKKQHIEAAVKRDYFYSQGVINGVNGFDWYKANPTRDFYSFFRDTLKVSDKSPENVKLIKGRLYTNLPPYLEEVKKSNYFLVEYNKYYKDMVASKEKLSQIIDIYNIKAIASKKLGDYESALKSCDIAIKINPKDLEASNFKKFILKEKTDFEKAIEYSDNTFRVKSSYQMNNFDYFLKLPYLHQVSTIDVSNNQIDDNGAKVLANSLAKGQMPKLKVLHLHGNKITDEGISYFLDGLKSDQIKGTATSFTAPKSTIDKIMEFFGKGSKYYVNEFHKAQQSSKEADIAVNGKDGFGHCVQVVRTASIDFASAMAQKAIAAPPIVKKAMEKGHPYVKLIVGGALVGSALNDMKGAFLSEDFAYCMAWFNKKIGFGIVNHSDENDDYDMKVSGDNAYESNE